MRELAGRFALLTAGVLVPLLVLEGVVHLVEAVRGPILPVGPGGVVFTETDPRLGWKHVPNVSQQFPWPEHPEGTITLTTNDLGLREDTPTPLRPPATTTRVLALGDSHTDGLVDNNESWPNVLERASLGSSMPLEVLNAGVSGYEPWQYLESWRILGPALQPEIVLVGFYLGNDLINSRPPARGSDAQREQPVFVEPGLVTRMRVALRRECRLCALLSLVTHRTVLDGPTFEESQSVRGATTEERQKHVEALRHCIGCLWQSLEQQWMFDDADRYATQLADVELTLDLLAEEVRDAGVRLVVVVLPSRIQVEPAALDEASRTAEILGIDSIDPPFEDQFGRDVRAILERLEVQIVEVRPALEKTHDRSGRPVYYESDWHLNVEGSRIVGEVVAAAIAAPD